MQHTNFQIDWIKREFQLQVRNSILQGKSAKRLDPPSTSVEETPLTPQAPIHKKQVKVKVATTWISDETNQGHGKKVPTTLLKAQGYGKKWKDCWVPKSSYMRHPSSRSPNRKTKASHPPKAQPAYKWVPKSLIPKPTPSPQPQPTIGEKPCFQWRPKKTNLSTKPASPTPRKSPKQTATMQWRPKLNPTSAAKPLMLASPLSIEKPNHAMSMGLTPRTTPRQSPIQWKSQML